MNQNEHEQEIELARHYSVVGLLKFSAIPILTILFASVYMIVDALFIANFANVDAPSSTPYAAANLASPFVLIFPAVGFMVGGGGNALIGKLLAENRRDTANRVFSMLVEFTALAGLAVTLLGMLLLEPYLRWQGADGELLSLGLVYGRIVLCGTAFFALQYAFQLFLITSGEEVRAFIYTVAAGVTNIGLDAFLMLTLKMGVAGAAVGTVAAQVAGGLLPLAYYCSRKNMDTALIHFQWVRMELKPIWKACFNGVSEMIENLTESLTGILYNTELMRLGGEMAVDAYGSVMYAQMIASLVFIGFNESVVPLIAYQFGANSREELRSLLDKCTGILFIASILFFAAFEILAVPLASLFADGVAQVEELTVRGFRIGSFSLIAMGVSMFMPSLFTALNNGLVSAIITVFEMLVFPAATVVVFSKWFGLDGIWHSLNASWILSVAFCGAILFVMKRNYEFLERRRPGGT